MTRLHPFDKRSREIWKTYPIRIEGRSLSVCCNKPTLLVQSMRGGFVTRNCSSCGQPKTLSYHAFFNEIDLWVACPECKERMDPAMLHNNYGFLCSSCDIGIELATLLPYWSDLT